MNLFENLVDVITNISNLENKGITYIQEDNQKKFISYKQLYRTALGTLNYLQGLGLKPGDELVFQVDENEVLVSFLWACFLGGIIAIPVTVSKNDEQRRRLFRIWEILKRPHLITNRELLRTLEKFSEDNGLSSLMQSVASSTLFLEEAVFTGGYGIIHKPCSEDTAVVLFSSGSTGDPKGVVLSHENVVINAAANNLAEKTTANDTALSWMPLTHALGLIQIHISCCLAGINQYLMPTHLFTDDPIIWLREADRYKATQLYSPNFGYMHVMDHMELKGRAEKLNLSNVRFIVNAAEPISSSMCNKFLEMMSGFGLKKEAMQPNYGMTEAGGPICISPPGGNFAWVNVDREFLGIGQSVRESHEGEYKNSTFVDLGYPVECCNVRICDDNDSVLKDNMVGHIQISGKSIMKGYYGNCQATDAAFTEDRWLRTGDVGFLRDGRLVITGRAKDIIFVNGQNVYPHDIERVVEKLEEIGRGNVAACGINNEELKKDEIVLFVICHKDIGDFIQLINPVKQLVARQMGLSVARVIPVKQIPKTAVGKIQRYRLGKAYQEGEFLAAEKEIRELMSRDKTFDQSGSKGGLNDSEAPHGDIERKLKKVWSSVLNIGEPGVNDNFFALGGDSLKASILVLRAAREMDVEIPVRRIFENNTIRLQAEYIAKAEKKLYSTIERVEDSGYYPASSAQKRMYVLDQMEDASTVYNTPLALKIEGDISGERLENSVRELIRRHECLRTSFENVNGDVVQRVHDDVDLKIDYRKCGKDEAKDLVSEFIRPFDLGNAPLLRVGLFRLDECEHILVIDMHHIICDGTSMGIFTRELAGLYNGGSLPELKLQYRDFSAWQNSLIKKGEFKEQEKYWTDIFRGSIPVLNMPTDYPRPAIQVFQGDSMVFEADSRLTSKVKALSSKMGTTLYMTMLGACFIMLAKYSGQEDIVIGTVTAGRPRTDIEDIIGMFVNTLAMRNGPEGDKTVEEFLKEVRENALKAYEHQDYQFEELVEKLDVNRDPSRNPLFDVMFVLQNEDTWRMEMPGTSFSPYRYKTDISKFDITLNAEERDGKIEINLEYSTRLFNRETMRRTAEHYLKILDEMAEKPYVKIADLDMLSESEKNRLLYDFNDTKTQYPKDKTLYELFQEQAAKIPDNIAVVYEERKVTYGELNEKANRLARYLRKRGVGRDSIVAMFVDRSIEMIEGILGILKAGGAYLPIDPKYPVDRITGMLEDSGTSILLTLSEMTDKLDFAGQKGLEIILMDELTEALNCMSTENLEPVNNSGDLAYVMYTSGSSGKPKGTLITHYNISRVVMETNYIEITDKDTLLQLSNYAFDGSTFDIYGALLNGARLVTLKYDRLLDMEQLTKYIKEQGITVSFITAALFNALVDVNVDCFSGMRKVLFGGERASARHVEKAFRFLGPDRLVNGYGPTESTVFATAYTVNSFDGGMASVPIGKPISNTRVYILDDNLKLQPIGVPGELCISGDGLGRGYLNRPELTAEKFIPNPFVEVAGDDSQWMYKTGDLARWLPDGNIECLGRIDTQIKLRGFRIELGEIEAQLLKHEAVREAVVLCTGDKENDRLLCAFIVSESDISIEEIREFLSRELPDYMLPAYSIRVASMPLTPNGKVDRRFLENSVNWQELKDSLNVRKEYTSPRSEAEEKLALIWQEVLGEGRIGINDNFFELGGDSIKAIQIVAKAKEQGMNITVSGILLCKTISKLIETIDYSRSKEDISQSEVVGEVLFTPVQKWFFEGYKDYYHYWNQVNMFSLRQDTDPKRLENVFKRVIEHHDALRIGVKIDGAGIVQFNRAAGEIEFKMQVMDLSGYSYENQKNLIIGVSEKMQDGLDIENDLLIRACVFDLGENGKRLLIIIHHLVVDIVSWKILLEDIERLYSSDGKADLPLKTTSFKEWSEKLNHYADKEHIDTSYWESIDISRATPLFKADPKDNPVKCHKMLTVEIEEEETKKLLTRTYGRYGAQITDILLSALVMSLTEAARTDNLLLNLEGYGREEIIDGVDLSRTIGWFTAIYPVYLEKRDTIAESIMHVREALAKIPGRGINYGISRYLSKNEKLKAFAPQVSFNYMGQLDKAGGAVQPLTSACAESAGRTVHSDSNYHILLDINGMEKGGRLYFTVSYNAKYIDTDTMEDFCARFRDYLRQIVKGCEDSPVSSVKPSTYSWLEINKPDYKELKIEMHNDITTYLHHSLPLCIILADERLRPWYYEHFTNIFSLRNDQGYLELDFLESWIPFRGLVDIESCLGYDMMEEIGDVVKFLMKRINFGYYSIVCMDEYYLPDKANYKKKHYVHQSLIYGYDSAQRRFMGIGFNSEHLFSKMFFDYDTLAVAFKESAKYYGESAPWSERGVIQLIAPVDFPGTYPYDARNFLNELESFIFSKGEDWKIYSLQHHRHQVKFGFEVYDEVVQSLRDLLNGKVTMDYRVVHLLYEQKKSICRNIKYVIDRNHLTVELEHLLDRYNRIIDRFNDVRTRFLELQYRELYEYNINGENLKNIPAIQDMLDVINSVKEEEKELLLQIYNKLHTELYV
jgi:amino acid adenylation domain-containing protein/non-ribosomal peptide synthase protein (TIGR01720 family)